MRFTLQRPCSACPFGKGPDAVRHLDAERLLEITEAEYFPCHMTTEETGDGSNIHCAGHLIYALANFGRLPTMGQVAARIGALSDKTFRRLKRQARRDDDTTLIHWPALVRSHETGDPE